MKTPYQGYYTESYKNNLSSSINDNWVKAVGSKLNIPFSPTKTVLDVACGVSTLGILFANTVYGIDMNSQAVKVAQKNGIKAKLGDVEKMWDYPNEFFDIVIISHIVEHVVNTDHLMREAKRVLKKKGLLIVATPNLAAWFNRVLLLCGIQPFFTEVSTIDKTLGLGFTKLLTKQKHPLGHLRVFTLYSLKDLLTLHEFTIIKTCGVEFLSFPKPLLMIDKVFSFLPSLASNIIIVGEK